MVLSENMVENLYAIEEVEPQQASIIMNLPLNELGNSLIDVYYGTSNLEARKLITDFMNEAGIEWMRKLLTRDTSPVETSKAEAVSVYDSTLLVAANDDQFYAAG